MERYRSYYAWQEAMKLGLALYELADELPSEEQHLLASDLRRAAVEVPAAIAQNVLSGQTADLFPIIKLQTAMELIGKVYPALDTSDAESEVSELAARMNDHSRFMEVVPEPAPAVVVDDLDDDEDESDGDSQVHVGVNQE